MYAYKPVFNSHLIHDPISLPKGQGLSNMSLLSTGLLILLLVVSTLHPSYSISCLLWFRPIRSGEVTSHYTPPPFQNTADIDNETLALALIH